MRNKGLYLPITDKQYGVLKGYAQANSRDLNAFVALVLRIAGCLDSGANEVEIEEMVSLRGRKRWVMSSPTGVLAESKVGDQGEMVRFEQNTGEWAVWIDKVGFDEDGVPVEYHLKHGKIPVKLGVDGKWHQGTSVMKAPEMAEPLG